MRHTPRQFAGLSPSRSPRGIGTLIGNGWLRENPRNNLPREWDIRSKSAMRKCMFLPVPPQLRDMVPPAVAQGSLLPPAPPRPSMADPVPSRRRPENDVRMMPAYDPRYAKRPVPAPATPRLDHVGGRTPKPLDYVKASKRAWWEDPIALGSLLILLPPIGLAAVWSSRRYSTDARWALTVMTALTMCLVSAVVLVIAIR